MPAVQEWLAWNEPNNPVFLAPQYKKSGSKWVVQSAADYAKICNAVFTRRPRCDGLGRARRLRRNGAARQQQPEQLTSVGLAARVPDARSRRQG